MIFLIDISIKKLDGIRMQGVSTRTFGTRMYGKLWEHVT